MWQVGRKRAVPVKNPPVHYARDWDSTVYMASQYRRNGLGSLLPVVMMPR